MIHVFITDIQTKEQSEKVLRYLNLHFPQLTFHLDLIEVKKSYPCGHTILRVLGEGTNPDKVISALTQLGFKCSILEDKVCA